VTVETGPSGGGRRRGYITSKMTEKAPQPSAKKRGERGCRSLETYPPQVKKGKGKEELGRGARKGRGKWEKESQSEKDTAGRSSNMRGFWGDLEETCQKEKKQDETNFRGRLKKTP